jgi:glycerate kinase
LVAAHDGESTENVVTEHVSLPIGSHTDFIGEDGKTVVLDMAAAARLCPVLKHMRDPTVTTTYGVEELKN